MKLNRLFALACLLFVTALPSAFAELREGKDYRLVPTPQPVANPAKIEVLEFFWYACPHCNDVQPALKKWKANMPKDAEFRVMPAVFRPNWEPLAKTYYALEAMGIESRMRDKVFQAIHADQINLSDEKVQLEWMAKQGVDKQKFSEAYNAFAMQSKIARSKQAGRDYDPRHPHSGGGRQVHHLPRHGGQQRGRHPGPQRADREGARRARGQGQEVSGLAPRVVITGASSGLG
ncbi:MAG TPA: thiol:disulfide interchange protein DsbA/DsbL, partial [Burkholderiales bacterium]